jgi:phosphoglycolate phosphatase-like HAD superfamily hydrolase
MTEPDILILFDIDGTLISPGKGAREALSQAIEEILEEPVRIDRGFCAGKTDPMIIANFLTKAGCMHEEFPLLLKMISKRYLELLEEKYTAHDDGFIYPGIPELLDELMMNGNIYLALLTGNLECGARIKLEPYGLNDYFPVGAFGDDGFMRTDLPRVALQRAESFYEIKFEPSNIVVFGDTADDVTCGKLLHARTIAIVRNPSLEDLVITSKPDHIFKNTEDTDSLIAAIMNN